MDKVKAFVKDVQAGDSRPARLTLKALSIFTGLFLIIAGIFGTSEFFESLIYFVGSLYSIVFGLLVLVIEAKDKVPKFKLAYEWIDVYLKFLTVQVLRSARRWTRAPAACALTAQPRAVAEGEGHVLLRRRPPRLLHRLRRRQVGAQQRGGALLVYGRRHSHVRGRSHMRPGTPSLASLPTLPPSPLRPGSS